MQRSARRAVRNFALGFTGVCAAALVGLAAHAGAPAGGANFRARAPSPAVPAAPLNAFSKVKAPKDIDGAWMIYSTGGENPYSIPPTSAAGKAKLDAFRAQYNEVDLRNNPPNQSCVEPGMPAAMGGIGLSSMEIYTSPKRIYIMSEVGPITRRIYMEPKMAKVPDGFLASRSGWSSAKWEGDTLVITTSLMSEWLLNRWPHTEDAVVTERVKLVNTADLGTTVPRNQPLDELDPVGPLTLVSEMSMHDAALYDVDPKTTLYFRKLADDGFQEIACVEGLFWEAMNSRWKKRADGDAPRAAAPLEAGANGLAAGAPGLLQGPARGGPPPAPAAAPAPAR